MISSVALSCALIVSLSACEKKEEPKKADPAPVVKTEEPVKAKQTTIVTPKAIGQLPWEEKFDGLSDGAKSDSGKTAWVSKADNIAGEAGVKNSGYYMLYATEEVVWKSQVIDISKAKSVDVSVDVKTEGSLDTDIGTEDHIRLYVSIDGGKEKLLDEFIGEIDGEEGTLKGEGVKGKKIQVIIRALNTGDDEAYHWDNVSVFGN